MTRFGLVGSSGVLVNTAILYFLGRVGGWNHVTAATVSTEAAILSNFALNDRWTFRAVQAPAGWLQRALRYNGVALGGLVLSVATLALLTGAFGVQYLLANLVAIQVATLWNYAGSVRFAWRPGRPALA